jgi:hypothetical protein
MSSLTSSTPGGTTSVTPTASAPTPTLTPTAPEIEKYRISRAFWLGLIGFVATMVLALALAGFSLAGFKDVAALSGVVSPFLAVLGTLVGTFFGVQAGSTGKEELAQQAREAHDEAKEAHNKAAAFAAVADPQSLDKAIDTFNKLSRT